MLLIGGLALAAFPGTSGFFSKDEILAYAEARGGMYVIFAVLGYVGALLTAVYTFRLIFRILPGTACKEAQELIDTGHVAHERAGQPGDRRARGHRGRLPRSRAPHRRAVLADEGWRWECSHSWPWSAAWSRSPGSTTSIGAFLEPVFDDSPLSEIHPTVGADWVGLAIGGAISILGIGIAYFLYVAQPATPRAADPAPAPDPHPLRQQVVLRRG